MSKQEQKESLVEASAPAENPNWIKFWHQPNFSLIEKFYHRWFHVFGYDDEEFPEGCVKDFTNDAWIKLLARNGEENVERVAPQKTDLLNSERISAFGFTVEITDETVTRIEEGTAPALTDGCRYVTESGGWYTWRRDPRRNFIVLCDGSCKAYEKKAP
jgi:hypothetical protein